MQVVQFKLALGAFYGLEGLRVYKAIKMALFIAI